MPETTEPNFPEMDHGDESFSAEDFSLPSAAPFQVDNVSQAEQGEENGDEKLHDIQELTLAQFVGVFLHDPRKTAVLFWDFLRPDTISSSRLITLRADASDPGKLTSEMGVIQRFYLWVSHPEVYQMMLRLLAFILALFGGYLMTRGGVEARRSEETELMKGLPFMGLAMALWLGGDIARYMPEIRQWFRKLDPLARLNLVIRAFPVALTIVGIYVIWGGTRVEPGAVISVVTPGIQLIGIAIVGWVALDVAGMILQRLSAAQSTMLPEAIRTIYQQRQLLLLAQGDSSFANTHSLPWYLRVAPLRLVFAFAGAVFSAVTWYGTSGNNMNSLTFYFWILSVAFWALTFAPHDWDVLQWVAGWRSRIQNFEWRTYSLVIVALILIMGLAFRFRFHDLRDHPREMTDDHVEKILDAGRVRDGLRPVFFANNGGREPFQMYAIALASYLPGLGINHFTLKVVAATESLLTIPILFWMAYEILEHETHRRRLLAGLLLASLVAVSYWHVAITRQALRIALTPLVASLLLIYLARALRRNSRADFIKVGLILGFGLYTYQAVRMLPLVIVIAVGMSVYFVAKNWRERLRYVLNLVVLVWISFAAFIPMFHYSVEYPDLFWRRTAGRLFGDDVLEETLDDGTIVLRNATFEEKWDAFQDNVPILLNNVRNVLLMFNWKGDVAAISGVPNQPAMNVISGALLVIGLSAWLVLIIHRRDIVYGLIPIFILLMLLPSALSIAFPVENPSHTRTSGAIPGIYLIAALPLAVLSDTLLTVSRKRLGQAFAVMLCVAVIILSYTINAGLYFDVYPKIYSDSFDPYSEPGDYLRGFVLSGGSFGNAFMIGYPHWWSHRAIGLAAGLERIWPNGVVIREDIPRMLRDHQTLDPLFRFNPDRDILFFYSPNDLDSAAYLKALFPDGYETYQTTYALNNDYMTYRVPALGKEEFEVWLQQHQPE